LKTALFFFLVGMGHSVAQALPNSNPFDRSVSQLDWTLGGFPNSNLDPDVSGRFLGTPISAVRLRHKPSGKAQRAFLRGMKLATQGAWTEGIEEFKKAIAADPDFSEAHGNLGTAYSARECFDEAVSEFRRAIELDPATGLHHSNLAYALIRLGREGDAELEARTAVSFMPADAASHLLLGILLARRAETAIAAEQHLTYAARELPDAHFVLAKVYFMRGAVELGESEMERYRQAAAK
jgi:tetratricopeptide (TPR) repeat protein